jgi:hypothetical protein
MESFDNKNVFVYGIYYKGKMVEKINIWNIGYLI